VLSITFYIVEPVPSHEVSLLYGTKTVRTDQLKLKINT